MGRPSHGAARYHNARPRCVPSRPAPAGVVNVWVDASWRRGLGATAAWVVWARGARSVGQAGPYAAAGPVEAEALGLAAAVAAVRRTHPAAALVLHTDCRRVAVAPKPDAPPTATTRALAAVAEAGAQVVWVPRARNQQADALARAAWNTQGAYVLCSP